MNTEAPEKIYIHESSAPKLTEKLPYHIEYTRTDAFIEKACFYIKNMVLDMTYSYVDGEESYNIDEFIEDFKIYMKGE
jgi:hypothetical protein